MDIIKISQELQDLRRKRVEAKQRLDSLSGGHSGGRGLGLGGRGGGRGAAGGVFSRLGAPLRDGLRAPDREDPRGGERWQLAPPGQHRPQQHDPQQRSSVFDRLGNGEAGRWGRGGAPGGRDGPPPPQLGLTRSGSGAGSGGGSGGPGMWRLGSREGPGFLDRDGSGRARRADEDLPRGAPAGGDGAVDPPAGSAGARKRLLSAVVVDGEQRVPSGAAAAGDGKRRRSGSEGGGGEGGGDANGEAAGDGDAGGERPAKRQARPEDVKRSRRLFGSLLMGTLQRFKSEDQEFRATEAAQRRQEAARKAEERAEAEAAALLQAARAERGAARERELGALFEINLEADTKVLELRVAKRVARRELVAATLGTRVEGAPQLRWLPKVHTSATLAALSEERAAFEAWRQLQLEQLEEEKLQLAERAAERRRQAIARAAERRAQREQQRAGGGGGGGADGAEGVADGEGAGAPSEGEAQEEAEEDQDVRLELAGGELDAAAEEVEEGEAAGEEEPGPRRDGSGSNGSGSRGNSGTDSEDGARRRSGGDAMEDDD